MQLIWTFEESQCHSIFKITLYKIFELLHKHAPCLIFIVNIFYELLNFQVRKTFMKHFVFSNFVWLSWCSKNDPRALTITNIFQILFQKKIIIAETIIPKWLLFCLIYSSQYVVIEFRNTNWTNKFKIFERNVKYWTTNKRRNFQS